MPPITAARPTKDHRKCASSSSWPPGRDPRSARRRQRRRARRHYNGTLKDGVVANEYVKHQVTSDNASLVGEYSARSTQNGQFVSGNQGSSDQTTTPGSRAALVQGYLGH